MVFKPGNLTVNNTTNSSETDDHWILALTYLLDIVFIPIIVAVGFVGNLFSAGVFLQANLRHTSCCLYLAARAFVETVFLLCLFVIWLEKIPTGILGVTGVCQTVVFLSYLTAFLSVWFVVWVTVENYHRICRPFHIQSFCTVNKARLVIFFTTTAGCAIYAVSLATNHVIEKDGSRTCSWENQHQMINEILSYVDFAVTFVVPLIVIILTMARTVFSLVKQCNKPNVHNGHIRRELQSKMTNLLFVVTLVFLLLNLPSHIIRALMVCQALTNSVAVPTPTHYLLQRLFQQLYYVSFAVNFFIYLAFGTSFRKKALNILCHICNLKVNNQDAQNV